MTSYEKYIDWHKETKHVYENIKIIFHLTAISENRALLAR